MKTEKAIVLFISIILMSMSLGGWSENKKPVINEKELTNEKKVLEDNIIDETAVPTFSYDIVTGGLEENGIMVKYPILVNSNNQEKADAINALIMTDISNVIDKIKKNLEDTQELSIDAAYDYENNSGSVLSIQYLGIYYKKSMVYPVNFYHGVTLSLDNVGIVPLSDLFVIDKAFVETFKNGMYAPLTEDLGLETMAKELIEEQYTDEELIEIFSQADAEYFLDGQGLILSVGVPHAIGDHIEMAINYEALEANFKKEHSVWMNYIFLTGEECVEQ